MFNFKKAKKTQSVEQKISSTEINLPPKKLSISKQRKLKKKRKILIIEEFGQSLINIPHDNILIPLNIIDLVAVNFDFNTDLKATIYSEIKQFNEIHKGNLRGRIYRESFNFQPGHFLMIIQDKEGNVIDSFKFYDADIERLLQLFDPTIHRLILVRYFVPPVPDDLYKYDESLEIPPKFLEVLKNIATYVDENFRLENLTFEKFDRLVDLLSSYGTKLQYPKSKEEYPLSVLTNIDCGLMGYHRLTVKQTIKDTVEKADIIVIPVFILLLAFFCSDPSENNVFSYHYLFSSTGISNKDLIVNKSLSFPKLFNQLLDESLLPPEFNQCLIRIYNEVFRPRQELISNLLENFRDQYDDLEED